MARAPRNRPKVKRTKTFTGCWTCRSRRVKCDATRPVCQRCVKAKVQCEGYGMRLVWVQDDASSEGAKQTKLSGRILFSEEDMSNPTFSDDHINSVLDRLEYFEEYVQAGLGDEIQLAPYTVFSGVTGNDSAISITSSECGEVDGPGDVVDDGMFNSSEGSPTTPNEEATFWDPEPTLWDVGPTVWDIEKSTTMSQELFRISDSRPTYMLQERLLPLLQPFLSSSSTAERQLLHFWVTSASSIMTCTDHPDNPFRQVVIPIALEAAASSHKLPGHAALLNIIYAFAGFHRAQLNESDESSKEMATNHYNASLRYLRQSLTQDPHLQYDAILAVIIIIISIDTLNGQSGQWQIHMRGAREWLRQVGSVWGKHTYGHVLYQMFECLEIMGHTQNPHLAPPFSMTDEQDANSSSAFSVVSDANASPYCLDKFFGITKPVLKLIMDTNRLFGSSPTQEQIAAVESEILAANPSITRFPGPREMERITRHHACTLYYCAVIYFERSILRKPLYDVQHLVETSLYHLEAYTKLTEHTIVAGLYWPVCVTACEAEDAELRMRCVSIIDKKARHGIGAISKVKELVAEVWSRRDNGNGIDGANILWQDVMHDLGIDLLLC